MHARLLVVGPSGLRAEMQRLLPNCAVTEAAGALDGLWQAGQGQYDAVLLSLSLGRRALRAVQVLRECCPPLRIVVTTDAAGEPLARQCVSAGADDYILEPLRRTDVEQAFEIAAPESLARTPLGAAASVNEIVQLAEVLRTLDDGPQAAANRVAELLRGAFNATGAAVQIENLTASAGEASDWVLGEPIHRGEHVVGRLLVGRPVVGAFTSESSQRLLEYARLVEAIFSQWRQRERWQELAHFDELSGLHNRRFFQQELTTRLAHATANRSRVTVMLFDIDNFKHYNDRFGHDAGDELIREVGRLLTTCSRERDIIARYGGDEFAVIFWDAEQPRTPGSDHPREPIALAERFAQAIADHPFQFLGTDRPGPVTISGGLACFPWHGHDACALLKAADDALLEAKRTGKNRIRLAGGGEPAGETSPLSA